MRQPSESAAHENRYQEALEESELRHRALLAGVLDPLIVMDAYGVVQSVSDSVEPVFGYSPEEIVGRNISLLLPEPHRSGHDGYLANYRRTGATNILGQTREFEVHHRDGHKIAIELSVSRVDVPGHEEPLFTGSFRDITQRKQAEERLVESEALLRAIFEQEFQVVVLIDLEGRVVEVNERALELLDAERGGLVGRPTSAVFAGALKEETCRKMTQALGEASAGRFVRFTSEVRSVERPGRILDLSLKPVRQGEHIAFVLLEGRDITELEEAKRRETEVLRGLATIGESAAVLAHEMRTPVTAVHNALRAVAEKLGVEDREVLGDLERRMRRLEGTLRSTLSLVKPIELEPGPCVLPDLIEDVRQDLREELARAQVTLDVACTEEMVFSADRGRLGEVLMNLVGNAMEVLEEGGRIEVRYAQRASMLSILVADDGPGIPPQIMERLFEPFATTRVGGTGLGLAIARAVVEAHRGTLRVVDSPLGGAAFEIELPLSTAHP